MNQLDKQQRKDLCFVIFIILLCLSGIFIVLTTETRVNSYYNSGKALGHNSNPLDEVIEPVGLNPSSIIEVSIEDLDLSSIIRADGSVNLSNNEAIMNFSVQNLCNNSITIELTFKKFTSWEEFYWADIWVSDGVISAVLLRFYNEPEFFDYVFRDVSFILNPYENQTYKIRYNLAGEDHPFYYNGYGIPSGSYQDGQTYLAYLYIYDGEYWHPYIFGIIT